MTGQAGPWPAPLRRKCQDHTLGEASPESWVDNTLSCFKSLNTPEKQTTKNPPAHGRAGGRAYFSNPRRVPRSGLMLRFCRKSGRNTRGVDAATMGSPCRGRGEGEPRWKTLHQMLPGTRDWGVPRGGRVASVLIGGRVPCPHPAGQLQRGTGRTQHDSEL